MSFKANLAITLHLHTFKNLALPHKARYALSAFIYQGKDMKNIAIPSNIIETDVKFKRNVGRQSEIDDCSFRSKRFNIEYHQEQIDLNDCCEFILSLQGFPLLIEEDIFLEFILLENVSCYFREDINTKVEMKEAERYRFKLENLATGIFNYCEGEFCETYISSFSFTLFAMITDYRFRPFVSNKPESAKEKIREKLQNIEGLMEWGEKYVKNFENGPQYFYQNYVKNLRYNSSIFQIEASSFLRMGQEQIKLQVPLGEGGQLVVVEDKQFFQYVTNYFPKQITEDVINKEIYKIHEVNYLFVQNINKQMSKKGVDLKKMREKYLTERKDLFGQRVFKCIVFGKEARDKQANNKIASKMRKKRKISELKIIDEYLFSHKKNQHYAFLEVNLPLSFKKKEYEQESTENVLKELSELQQNKLKTKLNYDQRNMLVVLVHGFQASSYDMQLIKRQLVKILPIGMFLASSCNEANTEGDISLMGFKLAEEVKGFIARFIDKQEEVIINFVCHSMGGVIARAALQYLEKYNQQMGFFFSLSTPHLGYLNGVDTMIKTGLWFMRKMNKIQSLDQLLMEDSQKPRESLLFKLSRIGHLRNFKKIILLSSSEDSYAPWHSARIQYPQSSNSTSKLEKEMIQNILGDQIVHRIDIHFDIDSTNDMDSFIGRKAHINLLTHECLFKLINEAVPNLFDIRQL